MLLLLLQNVYGKYECWAVTVTSFKFKLKAFLDSKGKDATLYLLKSFCVQSCISIVTHFQWISPYWIDVHRVRKGMAEADQRSFFLIQSDDHAMHSPNLVRCTQGWALKRRQANGLFLTSAEHNSAICCRESLLAPRSSLWNREWTNGNLRVALSSWIQDWAHMDLLLFSLASSYPPAPSSYHLCQFYLYSLMSQITNLPEGALQSVRDTTLSEPMIRMRKNSSKKTLTGKKRWKKPQEKQQSRGPFSWTDRHAMDVFLCGSNFSYCVLQKILTHSRMHAQANWCFFHTCKSVLRNQKPN